jgi:Ca2+-binding RTX toxin-like protein
MATFTGTSGDDFLFEALHSNDPDQVFGLEGNDYLGGSNGDVLNGGAGIDFFFTYFDIASVPPSSSLFNATANGGAGWDYFIFWGPDGSPLLEVTDYVADLAKGLITATVSGYSVSITLASVEGVWGTAGNDQLIGNAADNFFSVVRGADTVNGGAGFDVVDCYTQDYFFSQSGVVADLAAGTYSFAASVSTLVSIEGVCGSPFADKLLGSDGNNRFWPGLGEDQIVGRLGADTVSYESMQGFFPDAAGNLFWQVLGGVSVNLTLGSATKPDGSVDVLLGIEGVLGSFGQDTIRGSAASDTLMGGGGADRLYGGNGSDQLLGFHDGLLPFPFAHYADGADTLDGGAGLDSLIGGAGDDSLIGGAGADRLQGDDGDDLLYGFLDNSGEDAGLIDGADTLDGGAGSDTLRGNRGNDSLSGGDGDDNLRGDAGNDTIDGGLGYDRVFIRFDELPLTTGVAFSAALIGSTPELLLGDGRGGQDLLKSIEAVNLTGTAWADTLTGSAGNDYFRGEGGDDVLRGGTGFDVVIFDDAPGAVQADLSLQRALGAEGSDSLVGFEGLSGSAFGDTLKGNSGLNLLEGMAGNDTLSGVGGSDELYGGNGNDRLDGGAGNDVLMGELGKDRLLGSSGKDQIWGGGGADTLTGGIGNDGFYFSEGPEAGGVFDRITDFMVGEDHIYLYGPAYAGLGPDGTLASEAFTIGAAASTSDQRLIFNDQTGHLYYDIDGNGAQAQVLLASIAVTGGALSAGDLSIFS